jgi:carboxypeptidase Q
MLRKSFLLVTALGVLLTMGLAAEERIDHAMNAQIRKEGRDHSQVMRTMHFLTDVYGPRLTGSPNYKAAADWAVTQLKAWGLENVHLEPWDFGHPGWMTQRHAAYVTAPYTDTLVAEVLAWTPSTNGTVKAAVFRLQPPEGPMGPTPVIPSGPGGPPPGIVPQAQPLGPTQEELTAYLDKVKANVTGKIVLVGSPAVIPVDFNPAPKRTDYDQLRQRFDPLRVQPSPQGPPAAGPPRPPQAEGPRRLPGREVAEQVDAFLVANGAAVRLNDAGRAHGQIRAFNNRTFDTAKAVPTLVVRNEDYGRIWRVAEDGTPVEMEITIVNRDYPEGKATWNVVGEIPGTDKKDEVVMLGGHLDSWHAATGATDNAAGSAVMMEAVRILKTLGVKPRRTIRVALWSAEEQGLLGSQAYVKEHFGTFEEPKPEFATFNGYFNVDSGTGRVRGMSIFGPPEAATVLREALAPFEDLGLIGSIATDSRRTGGTDSTSFNAAGLPGIGGGQDPIEYGTHTWHTNLDTYERIVEEDMKKSAIVVAAAVYHVAMRDEMLPRFSKDKMPAPPRQPTQD